MKTSTVSFLKIMVVTLAIIVAASSKASSYLIVYYGFNASLQCVVGSIVEPNCGPNGNQQCTVVIAGTGRAAYLDNICTVAAMRP